MTTKAYARPAWFEQAIAAPHDEGFVECEGARIHYLHWGVRGNPGLVLVHGGAAHAHWWSFLAPLLTSHYDVVALDMSGHGDSDRRESYPRETWAREVMAVSDAMHFPGPPVVIGHSLGGLVAIIVASQFGDRLAGAIIVDSPVNKPSPESDAARYTFFKPLKIYPTEEAALARFKLIPEQPCENAFIVDFIARHSLHRVPTPPGHGGEQPTSAEVEVPAARVIPPGHGGRGAPHPEAGGAQATSAEGGARGAPPLERESFSWKFDPTIFVLATHGMDRMSDHLAHVKCRVALLRGEYSVVVPRETSEYMFDLLDRSAPLVEIPQAHHHLLLDQPLAFIAATRALLADWEHSVPRHLLSGRPIR